jgi:hypothetical protein
MSDLLAFAQLGFRHIVSLDAVDHLLFLLALAATYRFRDWDALVWAVSAFTVGHSVTLALAVTNVLVLPSDVIEFLIPATIVATAAANLAALRSSGVARPRVLLVGLFGLIHGAGFANYLRELFMESIGLPLLGFNVGIELGQLVVLGVIWAALPVIDRLAKASFESPQWTPYRVRVLAVSLAVAVVSTGWAAERLPW